MKTPLQTAAQRIAILFLLLVLLSALNTKAQLNGLGYTINPGSAASATNYQSILAAVNDLSGVTRGDGGPAQGPGISGPVKITVTAGSYTYSSTLTINAIAGAGGHGGADSVIFDGNNVSTLTQAATSGNNTTLWLWNASYVTIKNFTITAANASTANSAFNFWGIGIVGNNSASPISHIGVSGCTINMATQAAVNVTIGTTSWDGIVVNGSVATNNVAQNISGYFNKIYLNNNTINNGHYGIISFGNNTPASSVCISGNTINNFSTMGINLFNLYNPSKIKNNILSGGVANSNNVRAIAMNTAYNPTSTTDWQEISGNYITCFGRYGMLLNGSGGNSSQPTRIINNIVYMSSTLAAAQAIGYLNSNNDYIKIWNNSLVLNTGTTTSAALTLTAASVQADIRNNIFAYIGNSTGFPFQSPSLASIAAFNYNVFYNSNTTNQASIGGVTYSTSTVLNNNYGGATTFNANSVVANPNFVNTTSGSQNLHITGLPAGCVRGDASLLSTITTDYDGQARVASQPNIGADEISLNVSLSAPSPICAGSNETLTASNGTGTTTTFTSYTWNPGSVTGNPVTVNPVTNTTYTVMGSDASCSSVGYGRAVVTITGVGCGFTITSSAGANGSISPLGATSVSSGGNQAYTITPNACYQVLDVLVDGISQGAITTYTFSNVTVAHTISATFTLSTYTITTTAGANGSISPTNPSVNCGSNQSFTITPNTCYQVANVLVDGISQGAITTYTFNNVQTTHTISATFSYNPLTISVTPSPATTCISGSVITASGAGASGTYAWSPNTNLSATTGAAVTATPSAAVTYTIVGTNTSGCTGTNTVIATPAVPLVGTYNIDPVASGAQLYANGGRYFVNFPTAIAALSCAGISGNVIVNVAPGTYTGQIDIPAINGAGGHGGADSIIFDGGSAATTTLTQASPTGNNFTVRINNASYITIKNFTITAAFASTANSGFNFWGVVITGPTSGSPVSHNGVINCTINMATQSAIATVGPGAPAWIGIVVDGETSTSNNSANIVGYFSKIYLVGNTINNGHHGIYAFGSAAAPSEVNMIGNTITGFSTFGLNLFSIVAPKIRNNTINGCVISNGAETIAMNGVSNASSTTDWVEISGNTIISAGRYGILLNGAAGSASQPTRIYNNMIYLNSTLVAARGISYLNSTFSPGNNYINIWNNSIVLNTPSTATSGALTLDAGATNADIRNNIFAYIGTSTGLPVVIATIASVTAFDYNIFYSTGSTPNNEAVINGVTYTNATILNNNYGGSTTFNTNSAVIDPHFISTTPGSSNLHITQQCNRGTLLVSTDFDGQNRATPPNIGADEIASNSTAVSVTAPASPSTICSGGSVTLTANCSVNCSGISYTWSPSTGLSATTGSSLSAAPVAAGTYTYTVTGTNSFGCTASATAPAITVNPLPTVGVTPPSGNICSGDVLPLTASGAAAYTWAPATSLDASTGASVNASPTTNTIYTITGTSALGCSSTNTITVTVRSLPALAVTPPNAVCLGTTSTVLTASGASTYAWAPNTDISATTGSAVTVQISNLTYYTVTGTGANGCTTNVVVPVATVATGGIISPTYSIICSGATKALSVSGAAGHDYQWQKSSDNITWTNITGATTNSYTTSSADGTAKKYYRLMSESNACWNVASTTAVVDVSNPAITVTVTATTDNSITLDWTPVGSGNYTVSWSGTTSGNLPNITPPKTITGLTANGNYNFTVSQTGATLTGCPATGSVNGVTTLCAVPTSISAIAPGSGLISVSWTGPAANYRVYYRSLFSSTGYATKDVTNAISTTITRYGTNYISGSTTYEIYVSRLDCPNTGNTGQPSSRVYVTTPPSVACTAPVIDSVKSICPVQIEVWVHGAASNQYQIYLQRLTPTVQSVNSYPITGGHFSINIGSAGQTYLIAAASKCGTTLSNLVIWPGNLTVKPICNGVSNLVLSNPNCNGFSASWNADQCLSNTASYYQLYIRQAGTITWNSYPVSAPASPVGPFHKITWLGKGRTYDAYVKAVYKCNGYVTFGQASQVQTITTLSAGCREEEIPTENQPVAQLFSDNKEEVLSLYPNPNSGQFMLDISRLNNEVSSVRIEVINMMGQVITTHLTTVDGGHMNEFITLPNNAATGNYFVRVTVGNNIYTTKMNISR